MRSNKIAVWWLLALIVTVAGVLVSFRWLDMVMATGFAHHFHRLRHAGEHLGSPILVGGETVVTVFLVVYRIAAGRLPELGKVTVVGCATSLCVFALNEFVLKVMFGVATPDDVLAGLAPHAIAPFQGTWQSSFPSGHMTLACGFVATFLYQDRRLLALLGMGVVAAAVLLVLGGWHFVSDVIAGVFTGGTAGVLAAATWRQDRLRIRA